MPGKGYRVAVKELKRLSSMSDEEFKTTAKAEAEALKTIRALNHTHLIKAIAYYTDSEKHFFVFPWAGGGNLRDFWDNDPPKLDSKYLNWVFTQLYGLASAIKELHHGLGSDSKEEKVFRHGDLKPENILCFKDIGISNTLEAEQCTLVIADVGLSRVHDMKTEMRKFATSTQSGTILYEPPERELFPTKPRTRRYDIWSLGCIYLEFIIWLLYDTAGLNRFRSEIGTKKFYVLQPNQAGQMVAAGINEEVKKWIEWIQKDPRCPGTTGLGRLVNLIETRLLVVSVEEPSDPQNITSKSNTHETEKDAEADSDAQTAFSMIVRSPTNLEQLAATDDSSAEADSTQSSRAYAKDVYKAMKKIFSDATSSPSPRIEWMVKYDGSRQGPRKYGESLAAGHAQKIVVR
jgi:serine/threonine protein kinase